jgi:cytochrome o ubiquinol oxidase subunit 2
MSRKYKIAAGFIALVAVIVLATIYFQHHPVAVLDPKGPIGQKERNLMYVALGLSLIVVIPVFTMTFLIAWKYRAGNKHADYRPEWDHNLGYEAAWWGIPTAIILVLSVVAWNSSHSLDPYKPLAVKGRSPLTIQVVALNWKWLFIYPQQGVATINLAEFPVNTPLNFEITADAPMNSFWIPQLGGQIYAMPGMATELHLMAGQTGDYRGSSANISGAGFADMDFTARATSQSDYNKWLNAAKNSKQGLDSGGYQKLVQNSQNNPVSYYKLVDSNIFSEVVDKYMGSMDMSGGAQ